MARSGGSKSKRMKAQNDQILAIIRCAEMPEDAVAALSGSVEVEERSFDESYLEFLDEQIAAKARGAEWDDLYAARRENFSDYAGVSLIDVSATSDGVHYWVKMNLDSETVIHWESIAEDGFSFLNK